MARERDTDDLATLLDELRTTLDDLDRALERQSDDDRRPRPPARPRGSDVVRFTEEYTIPTVISVLETTISSLELLQGVLRLANPERRLSQGDAADRVDQRVRNGTERALEDLRQVLTGSEPPTDPVARDVFEEARTLTAEIESILDESRQPSGSRRRRSEPTGESRDSVVIPVDEEGTSVTDDSSGASDPATVEEDDAGVDVDVDAELESIRDEVASESSTTEDERSEPSRGDEGSGEGN